MVMYDHAPWEMQSILAKLAPLNWAILLLAPLTGGLIYLASSWVIPLVPALCALVIYNNWLTATVGGDYSWHQTIVASGLFCGVFGVLCTSEMRTLLLHPEKRWWLTPKRWKATIPVRMKILTASEEREFDTQTFDISESGAFIPFKQGMAILPVGSECYFCIPLNEERMIKCHAEVVRAASARGDYPAGVGIRFKDLSWNDRLYLGIHLRDIPDELPKDPRDGQPPQDYAAAA